MSDPSISHSRLLGMALAGALLAASPVAVLARQASPQPAPAASPSESVAPVTTPAPPPSNTPAGTWGVASFDAWAEGLVEPRPGTTLTVSLLSDGRLEGQTGCGTYFGLYSLDDDRLAMRVISKGPDPCGAKRTEEAVAFSVALGSVATWAPTATGLDLLDENGTVRVVLERSPQTGLVGAWSVLRIARANGQLVAFPDSTRAMITFADDGSVGGSTGCRIFEGSYESETDRIIIAPVKTVGLPCEGDARREEWRFMRALDKAVLWDRDGDVLTLTDGPGDTLAELRLSPEPTAMPPAPSPQPSASPGPAESEG